MKRRGDLTFIFTLHKHITASCPLYLHTFPSLRTPPRFQDVTIAHRFLNGISAVVTEAALAPSSLSSKLGGTQISKMGFFFSETSHLIFQWLHFWCMRPLEVAESLCFFEALIIDCPVPICENEGHAHP